MQDRSMKIDTVTPAEAAVVLGMSKRQVQREIDAGPIKPRKVHGRRMLDRADLVYLAARRDLARRLKPEAREQFYGEVKRSGLDPVAAAKQMAAYSMALGRDVKSYVLSVDEGLARLRTVAELIEVRGKDLPLIKGTDIEVHRIAALLEAGVTIDRVLKDYPSLKRAQVEAARDYAAAHPKAGRPFPSRSVKQAFEEAGLDELADILDATVERRRRVGR